MSVSSSIVNSEMSDGTTIWSFPWTFPSQEFVMVVSELHSPFVPVGCSDPVVDSDVWEPIVVVSDPAVVVSGVAPVGSVWLGPKVTPITAMKELSL